MSDEQAVPKLEKPAYKTYAADTSALNLNGGVAGSVGSEKPIFSKAIEDVAEVTKESGDALEDFIAKVCREAVERATAESVAALDAKIKAYQDASLTYINKVEFFLKAKEEAFARQSELAKASVDLESREAAIGVAVANQTVPLRMVLAGALVTASLVWLYTIYTPEVTRIAAAACFSVLTLAPLIALYWRKG